MVDTLRSGWITTGPKTRLFEQRLSSYCGVPATVCVGSATAGLELMLRWYGVGPGDEVILPAYTYAATANVVIHCGAHPVLVDVGNDFNISLSEVEKALSPRTKVIIPVDVAGLPCDYDDLHNLVNRSDVRAFFRAATEEQETLGRIMILADAAHSLGAWYRGIRSGKLADISVFSFHAVKNLTTAEGGAICLNLPAPFDHARLQEYLWIFSLHGQSRDALAKARAGNWKYDILMPGFKCNMTDIQASIGLVELERYDDDMLVRRRDIFQRYAKALEGLSWASLPVFETDLKTSSYHAFLLRLQGIDEEQRDRIIQEITGHGVAVNVHFIPLPMMSWYRNMGYRMEDYPTAYENFSKEISLPVYYDLSPDMQQQVIRALTQVAGKAL